jgi:alpha-galactosidase
VKYLMATNRFIPIAYLFGIFLPGVALAAPPPAKVEARNIRIEFDSSLHSRITARFSRGEIVLGDFGPSESITIDGKEVQDFVLSGTKQTAVHDRIGSGRQTILTGKAGTVEKSVAVTVYEEFPQMAFFQVRYTNRGSSELKTGGWTNNRYVITAPEGAAEPAFWSYQSGSYSKRPDWVLPLKANFKQENYLGMNATDYGGGTPVVDVWRRDVGVAVGHVEMAPKLVSMPIASPDAGHA